MNKPVNTQSADTRLREYEQAERLAQEHLAKFDDMDYNVFSNQDWVCLHESHAKDVVVRHTRHAAARRTSRAFA